MACANNVVKVHTRFLVECRASTGQARAGCTVIVLIRGTDSSLNQTVATPATAYCDAKRQKMQKRVTLSPTKRGVAKKT
ncbi:hypothetical protein BN137_2549 [Cronobacter condimenti 1330]|uniref:Uncharacterized protein n=1 Tax=Cronobacter condimenti 1330 TaxID=1073999 RepID=K8AG29_9ENTR|nr:hypothetical protein BN137_2549 [Cronobacter condimenti 1330]